GNSAVEQLREDGGSGSPRERKPPRAGASRKGSPALSRSSALPGRGLLFPGRPTSEERPPPGGTGVVAPGLRRVQERGRSSAGQRSGPVPAGLLLHGGGAQAPGRPPRPGSGGAAGAFRRGPRSVGPRRSHLIPLACRVERVLSAAPLAPRDNRGP